MNPCNPCYPSEYPDGSYRCNHCKRLFIPKDELLKWLSDELGIDIVDDQTEADELS